MSSYFATPIQFGNLQLKNRVFLAPLAGVSDVPFRRICQELGAGLTYVEMTVAKIIVHLLNKKAINKMHRHKSEDLLGIQVTGSNSEDIYKAVTLLDQKGYDTIDINMGCPVKKITKANCGSAILKDQKFLSEIVSAARAATQKPLSAKYRLGFTREEMNVEETSQRVVQANVDMFTIHGRTASENYANPVDFEGIKKGICSGKNVQKKSVVTVGNGNVFGYKSAQKMRQKTGCDAVMVSRGALGNPWVFPEIIQGKTITPTLSEWLDIVLRHLEYHKQHYGESKRSAILTRKHLLWYAKGFPGCRSMHEQINQVESVQAAIEIFCSFAAKFSSNMQRCSIRENSMGADYDPKYDMDRKYDR